ncbi:MAG: S-adenosylmethionine:tRNA ribosyltransferase-isomerase, partial [Candidatus Cloacimonetes bacterium]|nr:S-adenosylmethionine:tRNA ribosyltransferase-isomerase [Candidatus Cloacimonadota bacterium]
MTDLFDLKSYQYDLPKELIAQYPLTDRSASKLMVVDRHTGQIDHKQFSNILDYLQDGEVLVLNKTKVIPARLFGKKDQKDIEILLLHSENDIEWSCLVRSSVKIKIGDIITISDDFKAELIEWKADGVRLVKFHFFESMAISDLIDKHGNMPLPPYITRKAETQDKDTYQTIYAKDKGSVAAPTAGLHFTPEIFEKLKEKGVLLAEVLLHVGLGTFRPV